MAKPKNHPKVKNIPESERKIDEKKSKRVILYMLDVLMISFSHLSAYAFLMAYSNNLTDKGTFITLVVTLFIYTLLGIRLMSFLLLIGLQT
ncbi:hypothetical protein ACR31S_03320 [Streptococcus iniae]